MNNRCLRIGLFLALGCCFTLAHANEPDKLHALSVGEALLEKEINPLHFAVQNGDIGTIRALLGSQFRRLFLIKPMMLARVRKWSKKDEKLWKTLLEYAPQLAYLHARTPEIGLFGQLEAAFFFRDVERTRALEPYHLPFDHALLGKMFENADDVDEEAYMKFMWESSPVGYYLAYAGASLGAFVGRLFQDTSAKGQVE